MSNSAAATASPWTGTASPFGVPWQKLMMWIFIVTDALLFAGLLVAYGFVRVSTPTWPNQAEAFDMNYITLMTFTLITSSATMACGVSAAMAGSAVPRGPAAGEWASAARHTAPFSGGQPGRAKISTSNRRRISRPRT